MADTSATELLLIRHAPIVEPGILAGRRDIAADTRDADMARAVAAFCGTPDRIVTSPAKRCLMTAAALWSDMPTETHADLWEQDFGEWDGMQFADLPDLGPLAPYELAAHRPPGGESFFQVADRVGPVLRDISQDGGRVAVVAHAGVTRAALGLAIDRVEAGLNFAIAPWSVTRISRVGDGPMAIACVNWQPHGTE